MDDSYRRKCISCPHYTRNEVDPTKGDCNVSKKRLIDPNRKVITSEDRKMLDAILSADKMLGTEERKKYVLCDFYDMSVEEFEEFRRKMNGTN